MLWNQPIFLINHARKVSTKHLETGPLGAGSSACETTGIGLKTGIDPQPNFQQNLGAQETITV